MTEREDIKKLLKELLIDREERIRRLIKRAKGIIGIERSTGEPTILVPRSKLTDREMIALYILGAYFSYELGLRDSPSVSRSELSSKLGLKPTVISARTSELKREKVIKSNKRGEYEILVTGIEDLLDSIRDKVGV